MSRAIAVTVPVAGFVCLEYLDSRSFAQQCCASAQRVVAFPGINVGVGVCHRNLQLGEPALLHKLRNGDAGLHGGSKLTDLVRGRHIAVRCCQGSDESSDSNEPGKHASDSGCENENEGAGNGNATDKRDAEPPVWDLQARHKQLQAVAAKMGDPFRGIMNTAGKKLQVYLDSYRNLRVKDKHAEEKGDWDWERWQAYIHGVQEQQSLVSTLKFQLEAAVASENFLEAARLKSVVAAATSNDIVAEVMRELKKALEEER
eukprot:c21646_g1_i1 orf=369-1145(+)